MHDCPDCGQACDCDGEDTWFDFPYNLNCTHDCEENDESFEDDFRPDEEDLEEVSLMTRDAHQADEAETSGELPKREHVFCKNCGAYRGVKTDHVMACLQCGNDDQLLSATSWEA